MAPEISAELGVLGFLGRNSQHHLAWDPQHHLVFVLRWKDVVVQYRPVGSTPEVHPMAYDFRVKVVYHRAHFLL